ncbi:MAG: DUF1800 domain-containing protein [Planctomycetota bacterium]
MPTTATSKFTPGSTRSVEPEQFGFREARHLLLRAGFGGTPAQIQTLVNWGPDRAVDYIVDVEDVTYPFPEASTFDDSIMQPPTQQERQEYQRARQRGDENALARFRLARQNRQRDDRRQARDMQRWWLTRMIESPRPLEEKMTLFWHGHFATSYRTIENSYHMFLQNQMFRANALGNFGDLLFKIIRDPAMIAYLDNDNSRKGRPNENLARELMELFSLGVGNYTERDIKEGARALTGYTFSGNEFEFQQQNHDSGNKRILGASGNLDGDGFVRAILEERDTSEFMAWKLYSFFALDVPIESRQRDSDTNKVIRSMAGDMLRNRYEIKPVLRRLFKSEHFYSDAVVGQQIKSPAELIIGAIRSLRTPARDLSILLDAMDLMGQNLLFPPSVAGWSGGRSWINTSTLFVRQNILAYLLTGKKPRGYDALADEQVFDPDFLLADLRNADAAAARDPDRVIDYLMRFTLGESPTHARTTLEDFVGSHGGRVSSDMLTGLLLIITAMPEYQLV